MLQLFYFANNSTDAPPAVSNRQPLESILLKEAPTMLATTWATLLQPSDILNCSMVHQIHKYVATTQTIAGWEIIQLSYTENEQSSLKP